MPYCKSTKRVSIRKDLFDYIFVRLVSEGIEKKLCSNFQGMRIDPYMVFMNKHVQTCIIVHFFLLCLMS